MPRQIKYRIWNQKTSRFIKSNDLYALNIDGELVSLVTGNLSKGKIAQQFTGFLDKNDKEVFEGDILKTDSPYPCAKIVAVKWWTERDGFDWTGWNFGEADLCEVIGNVFENQELLTQ